MILARVDHLKARARGIAAGMESKICPATSVIAPRESVLDLLDTFRAAYPTIGLRLFVDEIGRVPQIVLEGRADLGLLGKPSLTAAISEPLEPTAVGFSDVVAVARPDHSLVPLDMSARPDAAMRVLLYAGHKKDAALGPATR